MFCYLEILKERTGITSNKHPNCTHASCKFCEDSDFYLHKNPVKKGLTVQKYGWRKEWFVELDDTFTNKSGSVNYDQALRLIHPLYDDIWVVRGRNITKDELFYKIFYGESVCQFKDLEEVNGWLAKKSYNGRSLNLGDFES